MASEFLFSFFGLLLGLAIAHVAGGMGELWRARRRFKPGSLVPLMGLVVLFSVSQQWLSFWGARDVVQVTPWFLFATMGVAFPYIFIGASLLPHESDEVQSLDDYYLGNNRAWLVALIIPALVNLAVYLSLHASVAYSIPIYAARILIPAILIVSQRPWVHRVGLSLLTIAVIVRIFA